jgi:hypothetical protein
MIKRNYLISTSSYHNDFQTLNILKLFFQSLPVMLVLMMSLQGHSH